MAYPSYISPEIGAILHHESTIQGRLDELARQITEDYRGKEMVALAILHGSLIFMADLLRRIPLPLTIDSLGVASYHGGVESSGEVTFLQKAMPDVQGKHVLVLDDILDTGHTLAAVRRRLERDSPPASYRTCVLLQKRKERVESVTADYVGFEIDDEFVVGYGLDYRGHYRNLPYIAVLDLAQLNQAP